MSLTELYGNSATLENGVLTVVLSELNAKANAFVDSLGSSGQWVGLNSTNELDVEVQAVTFVQAFCNYFTPERLANDTTANVSCSLANRTVSPPPFGEEATGQATLSDEYTLIQAGIPLNFPIPDPNNSFD